MIRLEQPEPPREPSATITFTGDDLCFLYYLVGDSSVEELEACTKATMPSGWDTRLWAIVMHFYPIGS